ncbi:hypothetical protein N0V83_001328 [Neocucurbitaria cava]|uniref:Mannan endo-1,6-alpha-mannosidase n=1 Tax=Neocucurbitaria cava TaxID=798079 RepID=A0A9W8YFZ8_9PLEO|nr:hypothetical protein N0V83_001328 [Neocucurbitaria cava]
MFLSCHFQLLVLSLSYIPNSSAQSLDDSTTDPTKRAESALSTLQSWYNGDTGIWDTAGWWNAANIMTMVGNLAKADSDNEGLQSLVTRVFANTMTQAPSKNPQPGVEEFAYRRQVLNPSNEASALYDGSHMGSGYTKILVSATNEPLSIYPQNWTQSKRKHANNGEFINTSAPRRRTTQTTLASTPDPKPWLDGFYDDDLWWALAWINAYDITSNTEYLYLAQGIFIAVTSVWPSHCNNGGIYWSWKKTYVNAVSNELFMSVAAHLANRANSRDQKEIYVQWAERTLTWFQNSGMINAHGTINDGLTDACENNHQTTWSYNQGIILGALVELHRATPDPSYLSLAAKIAKAALQELTDQNGVIHDVCEPNCGGDGTQFKGVFMRNLQTLQAAAPDDDYVAVIQANADSIWMNDWDEGQEGAFSVDWAGPFVWWANASTHGSAMDALVAAMAVG